MVARGYAEISGSGLFVAVVIVQSAHDRVPFDASSEVGVRRVSEWHSGRSLSGVMTPERWAGHGIGKNLTELSDVPGPRRLRQLPLVRRATGRCRRLE
ncbi:hypothetical protein [Nocardia sp. NPDC004123]